MSVFNIIGPIMVGPSSSHTAGADRIGLITRRLLGEDPIDVHITLYGSFAATGAGHGTDRAILAGLLGIPADDMRLPNSFEIAQDKGLRFAFHSETNSSIHPNSALINVEGAGGRKLEVLASSVGGGRVLINKIDGISVNFTGEQNTLIVHNLDQPGHVAEVTSMLSHKSINIATMQLYRNARGGYAVMVLETDQEIPQKSLEWLEHLEGVIKVTYLNAI